MCVYCVDICVYTATKVYKGCVKGAVGCVYTSLHAPTHCRARMSYHIEYIECVRVKYSVYSYGAQDEVNGLLICFTV